MHRLSTAALICVAFALTSACSGGGSGGGTPPTTVPGGVPTNPPVKPPTGSGGSANTTSFAVQSIPAGLAVAVTNNGVPQSIAPPTTPTTVTPAQSNFAAQIAIAPSNGRPPFVFLTAQNGNGSSHTVLYNQAADTSGSLALVSATSVARQLQARTLAGSGLPRFFSHGALGRPRESSTRLVLQYRAPAVGVVTGSGLANHIERAEGIARAVDVGRVTGGLATRVVDVPPGQTIGDLAARMRARPEIASATPERLYYKESTTPVSPNDLHFDNYEQWSMFDIKAPNAWGYPLGTGSPNVAIAIIDTGADFHHQDLTGGKIVFAESVLNGVRTISNAAAQDTDGHGTNVAGIAAADTNNGFGFAGVGYNTSLQIYKVFPDGTAANKFSTSANSSDVTQAIYDAVANGAKVINLSLGTCQSEGVDATQRDAVTFALASNVVVVAAAGNERSGTSGDPNCANGSSTVDFPAGYDGVIAVGATTLDDTVAPTVFASATERVASYSNAGPGLSLVAPGGDPPAAETRLSPPPAPADLLHWIAGLYTTTAADPAMQCRNLADCRALFAGTSQATPHVSGAAALLEASNSGVSPAQVKQILTSTADDIGDPNQGAGRLDVYRALAGLTVDPLPPQLPTKTNFVAFAYLPSGTNTPNIIDVTYTSGVPVASDGTFRIADIPAGATNYKIGVWNDANGNGIVDVGDSFGNSATCTAAAPCASAAGIVTRPVAAGFVLP